MALTSRRPMKDSDAAGIVREELDILREELDELHERLAVLTDRVASLERDRDVLLAAVETQSEMNEMADAWHERLTRLFEEMSAKSAAHNHPGPGQSSSPS